MLRGDTVMGCGRPTDSKAVSVVIAVLVVGVLVIGGTNLILGQTVPAPGPPQQSSGRGLPAEITIRMKSDESAFPWKDLALTGATVAVAVISLMLTHSSNKRTLLQKAYEDEIKDIQEKLNSFYGPFRQLLGTSENLYNEFRARQPDPENFRTLTALLTGKQFTGNDKILLEQIIEITEKLDNLILSKSELIDERLQPTLWEASTHFRLIRLAHCGRMSGEPERFEKFVYPRGLNTEIEAEIQRLRGQLENVRKRIVQ